MCYMCTEKKIHFPLVSKTLPSSTPMQRINLATKVGAQGQLLQELHALRELRNVMSGIVSSQHLMSTLGAFFWSKFALHFVSTFCLHASFVFHTVVTSAQLSPVVVVAGPWLMARHVILNACIRQHTWPVSVAFLDCMSM